MAKKSSKSKRKTIKRRTTAKKKFAGLKLITKRYESTKKPKLHKYPKKPSRNATNDSKQKYLEKRNETHSKNLKLIKEWQENVGRANGLNKEIYGG
ncbi:hypothetical protein [Leptospira interrogans]|uniref:hypothetical protein n=1 Tax=Leptospira interrogans TaxID=173 RepID=UPI000347F68C|nr:hypothetical protein [Leptospira interrogans]QCO33102.1 hypothetical protein E4414_08455 [Leptospira interrogans]QCO35645.1 hypothetical protein E4414_21795 [Leptospira interrogans]UML77752.1 hypothetical protein FH583_09630 [Leptospira interrogans]UML78069.1 hypothetical protein FH583_11340 [Leptospira interrogans]UMQ52615.1 hypothetical protein FH582_01970 [Leptospira interrogans]